MEQFSLTSFHKQQQEENEKLLSCMRSLVESHTDQSVGIRYCKSSECVDMNH